MHEYRILDAQPAPMRGNSVVNVIKFMGAQMDGGENTLAADKGQDDFTDFFKSRIDANTKDKGERFAGWVDVETLVQDLQYMLDQIARALVPLTEYLNGK
jgi:hypothetical protein